ncbi:hypothetical protein [uncultured Shimia sp.]|uniref:hypothetical protein n=1 Tax=uncultured Shimia sp. TaxID=573152 RepID=UPI00261D5464|nr:hypothetical protein [uncultured Shimia sp.]
MAPLLPKTLAICAFAFGSVLSFSVEVSAACANLRDGNTFTVTRNQPFLQTTSTVQADGSVLEHRSQTRNGKTEKITTTYWNGVAAMDRKSSSSHIQMKADKNLRSADLTKPSKTYSAPIELFINGKKIDQGTFTIKTVQKTNLSIGGCTYPVMVVRTSLLREKGAPIYEEALLSLDAGILLGNVAMTDDWSPKHGVFFDKVEAQ